MPQVTHPQKVILCEFSLLDSEAPDQLTHVGSIFKNIIQQYACVPVAYTGAFSDLCRHPGVTGHIDKVLAGVNCTYMMFADCLQQIQSKDTHKATVLQGKLHTIASSSYHAIAQNFQLEARDVIVVSADPHCMLAASDAGCTSFDGKDNQLKALINNYLTMQAVQNPALVADQAFFQEAARGFFSKVVGRHRHQ